MALDAPNPTAFAARRRLRGIKGATGECWPSWPLQRRLAKPWHVGVPRRRHTRSPVGMRNHRRPVPLARLHHRRHDRPVGAPVIRSRAPVANSPRSCSTSPQMAKPCPPQTRDSSRARPQVQRPVSPPAHTPDHCWAPRHGEGTFKDVKAGWTAGVGVEGTTRSRGRCAGNGLRDGRFRRGPRAQAVNAGTEAGLRPRRRLLGRQFVVGAAPTALRHAL